MKPEKGIFKTALIVRDEFRQDKFPAEKGNPPLAARKVSR
jgi:hypothetical protein